MPAAGSVCSLSASLSRGPPVRRTISSNLRSPRKTSRIASSAHFSPTMSRGRAIEQVRGPSLAMTTIIPPKLGFLTHWPVMSYGKSRFRTYYLGGLVDNRRVTAVIGVLSLAVFMSSLDLFIVNLASPSSSRDYPGTSLSSLSWVLNAYTIVFAAVLVPAGRWADRIGRRRLFSGGLVLFSFGSVLCGVAPGVAALIAARVIQAVGAGAMVPASLSLLLAAVPPSVRPKALGTWSALGALGAALGPVIGGALVQVDWRWVFWINVPVGVAAVFLAARVVPESKDPNVSGRPDILGAGLLAAAVGLVALALVKATEWGWGSASFLGLLAASVLCGTLMVYRSRRHHSPVIELELLRSRTFIGSFAASILYYAGFGAFVLSSVEFLTGVWHYSAVEAVRSSAPGPLMVLPFARLVAPRLTALLGGPGRVAVIACFVNALAQALWLWRIQV